MARWGRLLETRSTLSEDEHEAFVGAFLAGEADLRSEQQSRHNQLLDILNEADDVDLLARASLAYLTYDPDTYKEWETDRSPAHIEYLALQVLGIGHFQPKDVDPRRQTELTERAIDLARDLFRGAQTLTVIEMVKAHQAAPDDPTPEYVFKTRMESMMIRGSGYDEHLERVIHGCFDTLDQECLDLLGFTAGDALAIVPAVSDLINERITPRFQLVGDQIEELYRVLKAERRRPHLQPRMFPDSFVQLPPTVAKERLSFLALMSVYSDSRSLALVAPEEISGLTGIDPQRCKAALDAFSCPTEAYDPTHHAYPTGAHPLTVCPFIKIEDANYLLAVPSSMIDAIRPAMEDLLSKTNLWDRYLEGRAKFVETESTSLLAKALPGARSWVGIPWRSQTAEGEIDGLVGTDDLSLRLQCKSGGLAASARRGAPLRMRRAIQDLIEKAADQHQALATALESELPGALGFTTDQTAVLQAPMQFEVIVSLEDVTAWATETSKLRHLGALPQGRHVPWVLSLTDLMVVVDLLKGSQLAHYLVRRQRIERDGRIEAHDELDWVGHYLSEGLYFDRFFEGDDPPSRFRLLSYTEPIDAWYFTRAGIRRTEAPKPSQDIPPALDALLMRLEQERPRHWVVASIALLDGDDTSRGIWDSAIRDAGAKLHDQGWTNASQMFIERVGITLMIDLRIPWPDIRKHVLDYCRRKAKEVHLESWVAIGEGSSGPLFVIVIEPADNPVGEVFLTPPRVAGGRTMTALNTSTA